jgi:hypothetical protein
VVSSIDVERLREKLGVASGTLVVAGISTAHEYFKSVLHVDPLDSSHVTYLRGIDFHRSVSTETLVPGALLIRFPEIIGGVIQPERPKPYRFFATRGATPLHLGWNPNEVGFQLYQLRQSVRALVSFASGMRFGDARSRLGGDRQVVVPWNTNVALLHERDFDRQKLAEMFRVGYLPLGPP